MTMLEKDIEDYLRIMCERQGWLCVKLVSPGNPGMPDRLVLRPDAPAVFVEMKSDQTGHTLSPRQVVQHEKLNQLGLSVYVLWTIGDVNRCVTDLGGDLTIAPKVPGIEVKEGADEDDDVFILYED